MYPEVVREFVRHIRTPGQEGYTHHMYLDIRHKVTVGAGNMLPTPEAAARLAFVVRRTGQPATDQQIMAEWTTVHENRTGIPPGARGFYRITALDLPDEEIERIIPEALERFAAELKTSSSYAGFDNWHADAQLGVLLMAYALGSGALLGWRKFRAACAREDWRGAFAESHWTTQRPSKRAALKTCFFNADLAQMLGYARNTLFFPNVFYPYPDAAWERGMRASTPAGSPG